jgi:hypothetical protein
MQQLVKAKLPCTFSLHILPIFFSQLHLHDTTALANILYNAHKLHYYSEIILAEIYNTQFNLRATVKHLFRRLKFFVRV